MDPDARIAVVGWIVVGGANSKIGKDRRKVSLHTASHPHSSTSCVVLALDGLFRGDIPHCRLYCLLPTSCKITVENGLRLP